MPARPIKGDQLQQAIGERFKAEREARGVTQKQLCDGLQVSINTVRWHEAGSRCLRADQLVAAAAIIGCSAADLLPPAPRREEPADGGQDEHVAA